MQVKTWSAGLLFLALCACELTEVTTAEPTTEVLAELVLVAGRTRQALWMYRTGAAAEVNGATATLKDEGTGVEYTFVPFAEPLCVEADPQAPPRGTCYAVDVDSNSIRPGARYSLRIMLEDGRVMTGTTVVPGTFRSLSPAFDTVPPTRDVIAPHECALPANTVLDMTWSRSAGAAVYIVEIGMPGLRAALRAAGHDDIVGTAAVDLIGIAVSAADTTVSFPAEVGTFDRFDESLLPVLLAIHDGLPPDVDAHVVIAAADRNYVNWVRGGSFNPSGLVRTSSIQGAGRGVFGSVTTVEYRMMTNAGTGLPDC